MGWDSAISEGARLLTTIITYSKDRFVIRRRKEFEKLMKSIREQEVKSDEDIDDNLLAHLQHELDLFYRVWSDEIKSGKLEK